MIVISEFEPENYTFVSASLVHVSAPIYFVNNAPSPVVVYQNHKRGAPVTWKLPLFTIPIWSWLEIQAAAHFMLSEIDGAPMKWMSEYINMHLSTNDPVNFRLEWWRGGASMSLAPPSMILIYYDKGGGINKIDGCTDTH